jgi:hypothetical protein
MKMLYIICTLLFKIAELQPYKRINKTMLTTISTAFARNSMKTG